MLKVDFTIPKGKELKTTGDVWRHLASLPKVDELIILPGGLVALDIETPLEEEDLGEALAGTILCG